MYGSLSITWRTPHLQGQSDKEKGRSEMEDVYRQYKRLLKEAVANDHYTGLEILLQCESTFDFDESFKLKYTSPLLSAIDKKNVQMINLFLKHDYKLPDLHSITCECDSCCKDDFAAAKCRITNLKALCDPLWICCSSEDPFLTIFKLARIKESFTNFNESFSEEYKRIGSESEKFCVALLNEVKTKSEGETLMRYKKLDHNNDLSFIYEAMEYDQKEAVAHPVTQHFFSSVIYDGIPRWDSSNFVYRILLVLAVALLSPFTSILSIVLPFKCCGPVGGIAKKPFIKFVNNAASFVVFLGLLIYLGTETRSGMRNRKACTAVELTVFVWLCGFIFREIRQIWKDDMKSYVKDGWNWVDFGMIFFMSFTYITWFTLAYKPKPKTSQVADEHRKRILRDGMQFADGAFALAIILSFFRFMYICQVTKYLGLLQLCLSKMLVVIAQFAFFSIVMLISFTVSMVYLYNASEEGQTRKEKFDLDDANQTAIYRTFNNNFYGFWGTFVTMIHVSLTLEDVGVMQDVADGSLIELWFNILFIIYFGLAMVVLMNLLIALMNNTYEYLSTNVHREHFFARTNLWVDYLGEEDMLPIPLNLLQPLKSLLFRIETLATHSQDDEDERKLMKEEEKSNYHRVCRTLVKRYMRKQLGGSSFDEPPPKLNEEEMSRDVFLQQVDENIDKWKDILQGTSAVNVLGDRNDYN